MRNFYPVLCFIIFHVTIVYGQNDESSLNYGLKTGAINSTIKDIQTTILSEPYFLHYTLTPQPSLGGTGGFFVNYRFYPNVALESEIMYAQQGGNLAFNNTEKDFNYTMQFKYQYLNILGQIKLYPLGNKNNFMQGINVGIGPQLGMNITSDNIIYKSGGTGRQTAFGSDLEQQQQLRNVLKGKTNFGFSFGLGYEFEKFGLVIDARYFMGLTDVIETQANSYNFIENKNINKAFQFTIGWDFSIFKNIQ